MTLRNLHLYWENQSSHDLMYQLGTVLNELSQTHDEIGFLRGQIAERKRDVWSSIPDQSVQAKDRAASYSVADQVAEMERLEAQVAILTIEADYIRMIVASQ